MTDEEYQARMAQTIDQGMALQAAGIRRVWLSPLAWHRLNQLAAEQAVRSGWVPHAVDHYQMFGIEVRERVASPRNS